MAKIKKTLHLNKDKKKFLGVCSGVADYLEVEVWSVRLVFVVSMIFGAFFLIPVYFIAWFCLDDSSTELRKSVTESHAIKHFKTVDYKKKIYRNVKKGKFLGVCAGIADYLEVNVFAVRLVFVCLTFLNGLPIVAYFAAYFILDAKPVFALGYSSNKTKSNKEERSNTAKESEATSAQAGYKRNSGAEQSKSKPLKEASHSKRREFKYCARKFATLQRRMVCMEAYVTSSKFKLHREFKSIS